MSNVFRLGWTASGTRNEGESAPLARAAIMLTVAAALAAAGYFGLLYLVAGH